MSSYLVSEIALVADHLIVIGGGRMLADTTVTDLSARLGSPEDAFIPGSHRRRWRASAPPSSVRSDLELLGTQRFASGAVYLSYRPQSS